MLTIRGKSVRSIHREVERTVQLFAEGPHRRAGRRDVYRAYLTHFPGRVAGCANAILGIKPVVREVRLPAHRTLCYRPGTSDLRVFKQIFVGREYDAGGVPVDRVEYIIDLGSNIGLSALYWASSFPTARILCVEPDEENFDLLLKNIAQLGSRCSAIRAAVADHDGSVDFYRSSSVYFWSSSTDPSIVRGAVQKISVPAMSMPTILTQSGFPRVDLLKMDIEGGERAVLPGLAGWPLIPRHLVAELHAPYRFQDFARDVVSARLSPHQPTSVRRMAWAVADRS